MKQAVCYGPFEITMCSQIEDDELIERVFQLKFVNKNLTVRNFFLHFHSPISNIN